MWVLAGGVLEAADGRVHDTSVLLDPDGELAATYRKIHLFDVELPDQPPIRESDSIAPGDELVTHRVGEARFGLSICYDVRFPELYRGLMAQGAEVLCVPSQFQHTTGRDHWHALLRARAIENQCFVVAPAQWGAFGDPAQGRRSYGHSLVVDPWGRVLVEAPEEGDGVWFADLDLEAQRNLRTTFPASAASPAERLLLMRRPVEGGYELDDDPAGSTSMWRTTSSRPRTGPGEGPGRPSNGSCARRRG